MSEKTDVKFERLLAEFYSTADGRLKRIIKTRELINNALRDTREANKLLDDGEDWRMKDNVLKAIEYLDWAHEDMDDMINEEFIRFQGH